MIRPKYTTSSWDLAVPPWATLILLPKGMTELMRAIQGANFVTNCRSYSLVKTKWLALTVNGYRESFRRKCAWLPSWTVTTLLLRTASIWGPSLQPAPGVGYWR